MAACISGKVHVAEGLLHEGASVVESNHHVSLHAWSAACPFTDTCSLTPSIISLGTIICSVV